MQYSSISVVFVYFYTGTPDIRMSAVYYFIAAIVVLLAAFGTFFLLQRIVCINMDRVYMDTHVYVIMYSLLLQI